jgi:ketosteroid isomerase-like protein
MKTLKSAKRGGQLKRASSSSKTNPLGKIRALVARQARSWERNDFDMGAVDWLADGRLVSPGGEWPIEQLRGQMTLFHAGYADLRVEIKNVFASADGRKLAIEWDWIVTRRSDGVRGTTHDAIIVDLRRGKIKSWREYFDLSGSVEAHGPSQ